MAPQEGTSQQASSHGRDIVREYLEAAKKNGGKLVFIPTPKQAETLVAAKGVIPSPHQPKMEGGLPSDHE